MAPTIADWALSFALTLVIEVPVYALMGRGLPAWRAALVGALGSCITHPLLWFVWTRVVTDYTVYLVTGELLVTLIEGVLLFALLRPVSLARGIGMSVMANAASLGIGMVLRAVGLL